MKCICGTQLIFRTPNRTRRAGVTVFRLICPDCGKKYLATEAEYSHPYQTHPNSINKSMSGSYRITEARKAAICAMFGSVQEFIDRANLLQCNTLPYKT